MNIVEIIPVSRSMPLESLLYTTTELYSIGDLVEAPFQESTILGVVVQQHEIAQVRTHIRALPYKLRGGTTLSQPGFIDADFVKHINDFTRRHATKSQPIFQEVYRIITTLSTHGSPAEHGTLRGITGSSQHRATYYQSLCQEYAQLLVICPNKAYAENISRHLDNFVLATTQSAIKKINPLLHHHIVSTFEFALDTLKIIGNESLIICFDGIMAPSQKLRSGHNEFFDRAPIYASCLYRNGYNIAVGDELLPSGDWHTLWDETTDYSIPLPTVASPAIIAQHRRTKTLEQHHIRKLIQPALTGKRVVIYCNQRNLSGYISCPSCQHIERCTTCSHILRLVTDNSRQLLECAHCNERTRARDVCPSCGSIALELRRQGVDAYINRCAELSTELPLYTLTRETKKPTHTVSQWETTGGILVTTSAIMNYPNVTMDILFITPHTWNMTPTHPEEHLYEYIWLFHRSTRVHSLPITREILCGSADETTISLSKRAEKEYLSGQQLGIALPCTLL